MRSFIFICLLIVTTASCNRSESVFEKTETRFNVNAVSLNALVDTLNNASFDPYFNAGKISRKTNEFDLNLSQKLSSLGIDNVSRHFGNGEGDSTKIFILQTNWIPHDSVFLVKNSGDAIETRKGFYRKDKHLNETWGLGDFWQVIKIIKYMEAKQ